MFRSRQQGGLLCPTRLLRPDHLLCAGGLLRAIGLLHLGSVLHANGLLRPTAAERQLSDRDGDAEIVSADDQEPQTGCRGIAWLDEMIQSLPDGYRQAVQMAEIEEQSQQDVADRLGLSLSGAKSRVQRGRAMLKDALQRCCSFELDVRGRVMECDPRPNQQVCRDCAQ